jgi:putative ABC transport system permease protein
VGWVAIRMLAGDRTKFFGLIFGVSFAAFMMAQQVSVFIGIVKRSASQIIDVRDAPIWVMDAKIRHIDEVPALPSTELMRIRGVQGVDWAVPFYKGNHLAKLENGETRSLTIMGVDDATLVGSPVEMLAGKLSDLRKPNAVLIDKAGYEYMWKADAELATTQGYKLNKVIEINDHRAVVVGVCKASASFVTLPIVFTRFSQAQRFVGQDRKAMNFILASPKPGESVDEVCKRIESQTGRLALSREQFLWKTVGYFLGSTGIPVNFGITIALGFLVGVAIAGQTFYLFVVENLKQFGAIKAMGVTDGRIIGMVLLQGSLVGVVGYGIGVGLAAGFFTMTNTMTHLAGLFLYWQAMVGVAFAVAFIIMFASFVSLRRLLTLEPAIVFRG